MATMIQTPSGVHVVHLYIHDIDVLDSASSKRFPLDQFLDMFNLDDDEIGDVVKLEIRDIFDTEGYACWSLYMLKEMLKEEHDGNEVGHTLSWWDSTTGSWVTWSVIPSTYYWLKSGIGVKASTVLFTVKTSVN